MAACDVPFAPELFSAPQLQRVLDKYGRAAWTRADQGRERVPAVRLSYDLLAGGTRCRPRAHRLPHHGSTRGPRGRPATRQRRLGASAFLWRSRPRRASPSMCVAMAASSRPPASATTPTRAERARLAGRRQGWSTPAGKRRVEAAGVQSPRLERSSHDEPHRITPAETPEGHPLDCKVEVVVLPVTDVEAAGIFHPAGDELPS